jgi:diguanylate cyclase (GGDEF)-like protein
MSMAKMDLNITGFLEPRSKPFLAAFGLLLFAAIIFVDRATDWEITSSIFYLLPVSYFAWYFSSRIGTVAAFFSVLVWLLLDHWQGPHYSSAAIPYWNGIISLNLYLIFVFLVAEVKAMYLQERENSRLDFLTGTINQRGFHEALHRECERASRLALPTTLAYIDLDDFKQVNDRFDHLTGDKVLAAVGQTLRGSIRNIDLAGRIGGDEFCILLPHTDSGGAKIVLEKMKDALLRVMKTSDWPVTVSIGAVTFLRTVRTPDEMIKLADAAMYAAKKQGKNRTLYVVEA